MTKITEALTYLRPYIAVMQQGRGDNSCLGCDYHVPLLDNGLCVDCDTPGFALHAYRQSQAKGKTDAKLSDSD